jgi:hypothetical protein
LCINEYGERDWEAGGALLAPDKQPEPIRAAMLALAKARGQ